MSQFNPFDRAREIEAQLTGKTGSTVHLYLAEAAGTLTGTLQASTTVDAGGGMSTTMLSVKDSGNVVWAVSPYNVLAVGF
jgi:hypothetical protein